MSERPAMKVAAVLLAAGQSRRMPASNKLLVPIDGVPMIARAAAALTRSQARRVLVVTGHERERVEAALRDHPLEFVHNPDYAAGMSTSIRAALEVLGSEVLGSEVDAALFALGDMPQVRAAHVDALIAAFDAEAAPICVPVFERERGNPVLWSARFFPQLRALAGDLGARHLLREHAELVCRVPVDDVGPGVLVDVDTPEALAALQRDEDP